MKQKTFLTIIILFFIFSLTWIGSAIYHSAISSTISEEINKNISPIEGNFKIESINNLKAREKVIPLFELEENNSTTIDIPLIKATGEAKLLL